MNVVEHSEGKERGRNEEHPHSLSVSDGLQGEGGGREGRGEGEGGGKGGTHAINQPHYYIYMLPIL